MNSNSAQLLDVYESAVAGENIENGEQIVSGGCNANNKDKSKNEIKSDELLYRVGESPSWYISLAFALQQTLLDIGAFLTFPLATMTALCGDDSPSTADYKTSLIGTTLLVAGIATILQTTFGLRLPVLQGVTGAYLVSVITVMKSDELKCPQKIDLKADSMFHETNGTIIIQDNFTNTTITAEQGANYYRDNDGIIRSSNEVWMKRMNEIQGAVICGAVLQLIVGISGVMGFLVRFIGPLTIAPTLMMITYGLVDIVVDLASVQWGIALLVTTVFFVTSICMTNVNVPIPNCTFSRRKIVCTSSRMPVFSMFPVIFAIIVGWVVCYVITVAGGFSDDPEEPSYKARTDTAPNVVAKSPWFRLPYPFQYGFPVFNIGSVVGMLTAVLPGILESIRDYSATACVSQEPSPPRHAINRGVFMEGVGILTAGIFGTGNAATSWSANIVVIGISRVASRRVFQFVGAILMMFGVFSKFLSVFSSLSKVILGGMMLSTLGMLLAVGVGTLRHVDMTKNRNLFVFGFSIFIGMLSSEYANKYQNRIDVGIAELNSIFRVLLRNSMFMSGFTGLVLDNIAPGSRKIRGLETFHSKPNDETESNFKVYDLPFKTNWKWTKWVPVCPHFSPKDLKKKRMPVSRRLSLQEGSITNV